MLHTNAVVYLPQMLQRAGILPQLQSSFMAHGIDDDVVVQVLSVNVSGDQYLVACPLLRQLHANAVCFFGSKVIVGMKGLNVVIEIDSVFLAVEHLGRHEFVINKFGIAVKTRDGAESVFLSVMSFVRLEAIIDDLLHRGRRGVSTDLILNVLDDCHQLSPSFVRAIRKISPWRASIVALVSYRSTVLICPMFDSFVS